MYTTVYSTCGGEPVAVVVPVGIVADVVQVAEEVGHRRELAQTAARLSQILPLRMRVPIDVNERVALPEKCCALRAHRVLARLRVDRHVVALWLRRRPRRRRLARRANFPWEPVKAAHAGLAHRAHAALQAGQAAKARQPVPPSHSSHPCEALPTGDSHWSDRTVRSVEALGTCWTLKALVTLQSRHAGNAFKAGNSCHAVRSGYAGQSVFALHSWTARKAGRSGSAAIAWRSLLSVETNQTVQARISGFPRKAMLKIHVTQQHLFNK
jgi:hypothetical protein